METLPDQTPKIVEAIKYYLKQIKQEPNAEAYCNLGSLFALLKKWKVAIAFYRKAIQIEPNNAITYRNMTRALMMMGQQTEAVQCWYEAFLNEPTIQPEQYLTLGLNLAKQGQYQQAIDCYKKMLEVTPQNSPIEKQIFHNYQTVLDANPQTTHQDYLNLGKLMRKSSYFQKAIICFQKAIEKNPYSRSAYTAIQYTRIAPEQLDSLIQFYQKMLQSHENNPVLWGNLGDALTQKGELKEAMICYRKSNKKNLRSSHPELSQQDNKLKKECPPDFVIIGAAKCGTTSLYKYIGLHPQVLLPHKKEIDFFNKNYSFGIDWYLSHFPGISDYKDFYTGEASPNYLESFETPLRISQCFPQIKLIVLLRNPVERTISWYFHMINRGAKKRDLESIINSAIEQISNCSEFQLHSPNTNQFPRHIGGSLYVFHLQHWLSFFDQSQLLILKSEDLYSKPQEIMDEVFNFLGLANYENSRYPICNVGSYKPIAQEVIKSLEDFFQPYNQQLENYLNRKFDWDAKI
ncbi:sulfotransferase [Aphanothece hegewaldii CCALA 016]|uniref:Sulfotransferase n=1 Tax=Aphanothece hegewaldii CCALA 016 TaxID=2107694 RepID=A0A2T1M3R6_9CHRO|nr:tetratricopeptide repeat protein [Aphanothece hegewaldii]PSF39487.1 sulfotransferase [Aphanothece hegewaldii CCALA 016]